MSSKERRLKKRKDHVQRQLEKHDFIKAQQKLRPPGSDFLCPILEFTNTLPPPPFDPKFLRMRQGRSRLTRYRPTSLEGTYAGRLHATKDVGVPLDLIDTDLYCKVNQTS